ncbi:hypothetical protein KAH55_10405, partial [bacterium]|nr:hypothetical protein [bacterium]
MQRNNLFKSILIVFFLVLAVITLMPTFSVQPTQAKVDALTQEIGTLSDKPVDEVSTILCGDIQLGANSTDETLSKDEQLVRLENDLRNRLKNQLDVADTETVEKALPLAKKLRGEYQKLIKDEAKAIKLGLDLQGGTYLVSEVNIPQLVYAVAKDQDEFRPIYETALTEYAHSNRDFIAIVLEKLKDENIPAYRFFGETGDNDGQIRSDLNDETKDAVNRTLEVLRNRIDQFGVSEPNIQKQGDRRIVIELAGVKDITRAKRLIGTTAELRFQVVEGNKGVEDIMMKINRVLRKDADLDSAHNIAADTPAETATSTDASDETIQLSELFNNENGDATEDTSSVTIDKNTYKDAPFTSLLRIFQGRGYNFIGVAPENKAAVEWILNLDEVQELMADVEFLWSMRTETIADEEWLQLYVVRRNVELTGKYITNAKIDLGAGGQQSRAGEASVSMELNREGAKLFSQVTERIIDQHLAIILDNKVNSAPVVRVKIPNGRAQIDNIG